MSELLEIGMIVLFGVNIPQRWSISHLYQAMLSGEEHVSDIAYITTLSGYIHYLLTGRRELGVGDASGMFPITDGDYDKVMLDKFNALCSDYEWSIYDVLPKVVSAGKTETCLSESGARFLDPTGTLQAGISMCAPEGDAGTGMVATNAVRKKTGNVSAGTSIFAMIVLEEPLKNAYPEIDVVTTPDALAYKKRISTKVELYSELDELRAQYALFCAISRPPFPHIRRSLI